jgi:tetratricopeptide (TPR) repeat protein
MKANLFLTAIFFAVLPISICQASDYADRVPLADRSNLQNSVGNDGLQPLSNRGWGNLATKTIAANVGDLTSDLVWAELSDTSQSNSQLQGTKLDLQSAVNYNNQGVAKFRSGDNYGAIQDYDRAISINPKYSESYVNRGIAKFKVGNIQGAIQDYNRAIAIDPKDGEAYYNRGIARFESGEERSAIKDFDRAIAIDPQDAEVYGNRGFAKSTIGDKKGAVADLTKAAKLFKQRGQAGDAEKMQVLVRQLTTY